MKVNRANVGLMSFFLAEKVTSTPWSYTPITIIRERECRYIKSFFIAMFFDYCFLPVFDASINFIRCFFLYNEKINKKKNEKKTLNPCIDLVNLKVLFLRNSRELGVFFDCII